MALACARHAAPAFLPAALRMVATSLCAGAQLRRRCGGLLQGCSRTHSGQEGRWYSSVQASKTTSDDASSGAAELMDAERAGPHFLREDLVIFPDFITQEEHDLLVKEVDAALRHRKWEDGMFATLTILSSDTALVDG